MNIQMQEQLRMETNNKNLIINLLNYIIELIKDDKKDDERNEKQNISKTK